MNNTLEINTNHKALQEKMEAAWGISRQIFGETITFYLPGMFHYNGIVGRYPAVSITGGACALRCDHCKGTLLNTMSDAANPDKLLSICREFKKKGFHGVLISGGCDKKGHLPWDRFVDTIGKIKQETGLYITVHCGLVDRKEAAILKQAGVDQALLDVVGDDQTYNTICHVDFGVSAILNTMEALEQEGIDIVPHVVCGMYYGMMRSEKKAIEMISSFKVAQLVIVALMPPPAFGEKFFQSPSPWEVADLIADARLMMPGVRIGLGCARKRGEAEIELLAIMAGVNRMAIPSDEAIYHAEKLGLKTLFQRTCCSVSLDIASTKW